LPMHKHQHIAARKPRTNSQPVRLAVQPWLISYGILPRPFITVVLALGAYIKEALHTL
jgi:hypothetical protein